MGRLLHYGFRGLLSVVARSSQIGGNGGYVVKTRAARDLLAAVDAFLEGRQFVSVGLAIQKFT
jgi:hypothetical protein